MVPVRSGQPHRGEGRPTDLRGEGQRRIGILGVCDRHGVFGELRPGRPNRTHTRRDLRTKNNLGHPRIRVEMHVGNWKTKNTNVRIRKKNNNSCASGPGGEARVPRKRGRRDRQSRGGEEVPRPSGRDVLGRGRDFYGATVSGLCAPTEPSPWPVGGGWEGWQHSCIHCILDGQRTESRGEGEWSIRRHDMSRRRKLIRRRGMQGYEKQSLYRDERVQRRSERHPTPRKQGRGQATRTTRANAGCKVAKGLEMRA